MRQFIFVLAAFLLSAVKPALAEPISAADRTSTFEIKSEVLGRDPANRRSAAGRL